MVSCIRFLKLMYNTDVCIYLPMKMALRNLLNPWDKTPLNIRVLGDELRLENHKRLYLRFL